MPTINEKQFRTDKHLDVDEVSYSTHNEVGRSKREASGTFKLKRAISPFAHAIYDILSCCMHTLDVDELPTFVGGLEWMQSFQPVNHENYVYIPVTTRILPNADYRYRILSAIEKSSDYYTTTWRGDQIDVRSPNGNGFKLGHFRTSNGSESLTIGAFYLCDPMQTVVPVRKKIEVKRLHNTILRTNLPSSRKMGSVINGHRMSVSPALLNVVYNEMQQMKSVVWTDPIAVRTFEEHAKSRAMKKAKTLKLLNEMTDHEISTRLATAVQHCRQAKMEAESQQMSLVVSYAHLVDAHKAMGHSFPKVLALLKVLKVPLTISSIHILYQVLVHYLKKHFSWLRLVIKLDKHFSRITIVSVAVVAVSWYHAIRTRFFWTDLVESSLKLPTRAEDSLDNSTNSDSSMSAREVDVESMPDDELSTHDGSEIGPELQQLEAVDSDRGSAASLGNVSRDSDKPEEPPVQPRASTTESPAKPVMKSTASGGAKTKPMKRRLKCYCKVELDLRDSKVINGQLIPFPEFKRKTRCLYGRPLSKRFTCTCVTTEWMFL